MLRDAGDHVHSVGDETYRMVSCLCVMMGNIRRVSSSRVRVVGVIFSWRGGWCPVSHDVQGMLGLCVLHTVGNKVCPLSCCIELHCVSDVGDCVTHHYTQATDHPICFIPHRKDVIHRVSEHTPTSQQIMPIKKPNKTQQLTSLLQTTSSPHCTLTVLLLTVRSMNVKVFEISTSNCLYLHTVLV